MRQRLRWVRWPMVGSAGLLLLASGLGLALRGWVGAVAAAAGVMVVVASFLVSSAAIAWADTLDPKLVLPIGLAVYLSKLAVLGVALLSLASTGWAGIGPMAVAMLASIVVWLTAQVWWTTRTPLSYLDTECW